MITVRCYRQCRRGIAIESDEGYGGGRRLVREKIIEYEKYDVLVIYTSCKLHTY